MNRRFINSKTGTLYIIIIVLKIKEKEKKQVSFKDYKKSTIINKSDNLVNNNIKENQNLIYSPGNVLKGIRLSRKY